MFQPILNQYALHLYHLDIILKKKSVFYSTYCPSDHFTNCAANLRLTYIKLSDYSTTCLVYFNFTHLLITCIANLNAMNLKILDDKSLDIFCIIFYSLNKETPEIETKTQSRDG